MSNANQKVFFTNRLPSIVQKKIAEQLNKTGFKTPEFAQTLFHALDDTKEFEPAKSGYGEGSFIVIKAIK